MIKENCEDQSYLSISDAGSFRVDVCYYDDGSGDGWINIRPASYLGEPIPAPIGSIEFEGRPDVFGIASDWIEDNIGPMLAD